MTNATDEFLSHVSGVGKEVLCAKLSHKATYYDEDDVQVVLKEGYCEFDFANTFLNQLNFEYSESFGTQHLFGTIWFKDGTWSTRREYDGSEWWEHHEVPEIPEECKAIDSTSPTS